MGVDSGVEYSPPAEPEWENTDSPQISQKRSRSRLVFIILGILLLMVNAVYFFLSGTLAATGLYVLFSRGDFIGLIYIALFCVVVFKISAIVICLASNVICSMVIALSALLVFNIVETGIFVFLSVVFFSVVSQLIGPIIILSVIVLLLTGFSALLNWIFWVVGIKVMWSMRDTTLNTTAQHVEIPMTTYDFV